MFRCKRPVILCLFVNPLITLHHLAVTGGWVGGWGCGATARCVPLVGQVRATVNCLTDLTLYPRCEQCGRHTHSKRLVLFRSSRLSSLFEGVEKYIVGLHKLNLTHAVS